ncbi:MAG: phosphotransferase family protein [Terriglobales bacterium]
MHELIRRHWEQTARRLALARLRSAPDTVLVACFTEGKTYPAWLAKVGRREPYRTTLRREWAILSRLRAHAEALGAPEALDWREDADDACLILSGLPGAMPTWRCGPGRLGRPAAALLQRASRWIARLQNLIAADGAPTVQTLVRELIAERQCRPDPWPLEPLLARLRADCDEQEPLPATVCHGDFWAGNLLVAGEQLNVLDWNGFTAGSPLDDYWVLVTKSPLPEGVPRWQLLERQLFQPGALASGLKQAAPRQLPPRALRLSFYFFLARRLRWEAGLASQPRSEWQHRAARQEWLPVLQWLQARSFPAPFAA